MKNPNQQLTDLLLKLAKEVTLLETDFYIFQYLQKSLKDERNYAQKVAPVFFYRTRRALLASVIITLSKLFDESAKRSLVYYLKKSKEHIALLTLKDSSQLSPAIIDNQMSEISAAKPILDKIKTHRDKDIAHSDKKYFDNRSKLNDDALIDIDKELEWIVELTDKIVKRHYCGLVGHAPEMLPWNYLDVENIINELD